MSSLEQLSLRGIRRWVQWHFSDVQSISTAELAAWLDHPEGEPPLLLDIREAEEFTVSHLAGAHSVPPDTAAESLPLEKDRPIVVYCSVGVRSALFARRMQAAGFSAVYNLDGSIFTWFNEGRPVFRTSTEPKTPHHSDYTAEETPEQPAARVHPYNRIFGRLLNQS